MRVYKYSSKLNSRFGKSDYYRKDKIVGDEIFADESATWWTNTKMIALVDDKTPTDFSDEIKPIASVLSIADLRHIELNPLYSFFADFKLTVLCSEELRPIFVQSKYINYFETRYKNLTYTIRDAKSPVEVWADRKFVGCIMIVGQDVSFSQLEDMCKEQNENTFEFIDKEFLRNIKDFKGSIFTLKNSFAVAHGMPIATDLSQIIISEINSDILPDGVYSLNDDGKVKRISEQFIDYINLDSDLIKDLPVFTSGNTIAKQIKKAEKKGEFSVIIAHELEEKVKGSLFGDYGVYEFVSKIDSEDKVFKVMYIPTKQQIVPYYSLSFAKTVAYRCSLEKESDYEGLKGFDFLTHVIRPIVIKAQNIQFAEPKEILFANNYKPKCFKTIKDVFKGAK